MFKNLIKYSILSSFLLFTGCVEKQDVKDVNIKTRDKVFVNGKNGVIIDLEKNIAYYVLEDNKMYYDAFNVCENLVVDNITQWNIATLENLSNIVDMSKENIKVYDIFKNVYGKQYWTMIESKRNEKFKITIDFKDGNQKDDHIFNENGLICASKIKIK